MIADSVFLVQGGEQNLLQSFARLTTVVILHQKESRALQLFFSARF